MKTYEIRVYRDGKWWMIEIPGIDGLTQARRLSEVEDMARSYIAVDQDVVPSEIELRNPHVIVSGEDLGAAMRDIFEFRRAARVAEEKAAALMVETARRLATQQVPLRDIGEVLGVSHQRVHQLVQEINAKAEKAIESFDAQVGAFNARTRQARHAMSEQVVSARRKMDRTSVVDERVVAKKAAAKKSAAVMPTKKVAARKGPAKKTAAKKTAAKKTAAKKTSAKKAAAKKTAAGKAAATANQAPTRRTRAG